MRFTGEGLHGLHGVKVLRLGLRFARNGVGTSVTGITVMEPLQGVRGFARSK